MSDDLVKRICHRWIYAGCADECFWEKWSDCPSEQDILTPRMVFDRIEELEAKLAKAVEALEDISSNGNATGRNPQLMADTARTTLAELKGQDDDKEAMPFGR